MNRTPLVLPHQIIRQYLFKHFENIQIFLDPVKKEANLILCLDSLDVDVHVIMILIDTAEFFHFLLRQILLISEITEN